MAFCPECGKSNVDQAAVCDGCGKPIRSAAKGAAPVRFKGTMIMTGGAVPKPAPATSPTPVAAPVASVPSAPLPAPQPNLAFQATMMGPMTAPGSSAPPPAAAGVPPVVVPTAPAAPRVSPKGTMIGGMGGLAGAIQPPSRPNASVANPAPVSVAAVTPAASAVVSSAQHAPHGDASTGLASQAPSLDINYGDPGTYGGYGVGPTKKSNTMLWIGVGVVGAIAVVALAVGAAVWLGLISF